VWVGDLVTIVGDSEEEWLDYQAEFADLDADVIVFVYNHGGFEQIGDAAERDTHLFMRVCHLVVTRQALALEPQMTKRFGAKFRLRYKELCDEWRSFRPKDLARSATGV
jgi:hypothetical protein